MKILLIGAGALGAYYCGRLAQNGVKTEYVLRSEYDVVSQNGYDVDSVFGNFHYHPDRILRHAGECSEDVDYIVLATKVIPGTDRVGLLIPAVQRAAKNVPILVIQNGVEVEREVAAAFPDHEVLGGVAYILASRPAPGKILQRGHATLLIGGWNRPLSVQAKALITAFDVPGVEVGATDDLAMVRWKKLIWNLAFNPLSVLSGELDSHQMLDDPRLASLVRKVMTEVVAVAQVRGVALTPAMIDEQLEYTRTVAPCTPSMLQDYRAGRPMEVKLLLDEPIAIARKVGVAVPLMECFSALLHSLDEHNPRRKM